MPEITDPVASANASEAASRHDIGSDTAEQILDNGTHQAVVSEMQETSDIKHSTTRTAASHHETADEYVVVIAQLCPRYLVIICKDGIQWILQCRDGQRAGRARWTGVSYFRTRGGLIKASRAVRERVDPNTMAILAALPSTIGGVT